MTSVTPSAQMIPAAANIAATGIVTSITSPPNVSASGSPFAGAEDLEQAHQVLLSSLQPISHAFAVLHRIDDERDDQCRVKWLRSDLTDDRANSQGDELVALCKHAAVQKNSQHRRRLSPDRVLIAIPIQTHRNSPEAIGLIAPGVPNVAKFISDVERLVQQFAWWQVQHELKTQTQVARDAASTVELMGLALSSDNRRDCCQVMVTDLAKHLNLRRAAIGIRPNSSSHCRLIALSDSTRIDGSASHTRVLENVMDEALLFGAVTVAGQQDGDEGAARLARELSRDQAAVVITVPLSNEPSEIAGAFVAMVDTDVAAIDTRSFLEAVAPHMTAVLSAVDGHGSMRSLRRLTRAAKTKTGVIALASTMMLAAAMFVPIDHRESCQATLEPNDKRFVAAPFDATLQECQVAPGDLVRQGDLLATLDGRQLRLERESMQANHDQAAKKRDAAQASGAYAEQRIAQLEVEGYLSELKLLDHRLQALELRSPVDGIVVAGDLKRAKGAPLSTGQSLFEVAPLDEMMIEVAVAEHQISHVAPDQSATLRLNAYPEKSWETTVRGIHPRSEIRDEDNVFIAECSLSNVDQMMRPGMKGIIKIDCGQRKLGWVLFHRPIEAVWRWLWW